MAKRKSLNAAVPDENEWRAEDDLRTLTEAEKIEKDPSRMAKVRALAKAKMLALARVATEND